MKNQHMTVPIGGLSSGGGGALMIERALARTAGVVFVYVNQTIEMVYIMFDPVQVDPNRLTHVVELAGFHPGVPHVR